MSNLSFSRTHRSDAGKARTRGPSVSNQASLATALPVHASNSEINKITTTCNYWPHTCKCKRGGHKDKGLITAHLIDELIKRGSCFIKFIERVKEKR